MGACPIDVIAEAREWRRRHGGTVYGLWPYAASALAGLHRRLPKVGEHVAHAGAIAAALTDVPGVEVVPDPPVTPMWTWGWNAPTRSPNRRIVELAVGDATLTFSPTEVAEIVARLTR